MADTAVSALPTATAPTGAELILLSQSASDKQISLSAAKAALDWVRPSDWPAMPATANNTIHALVAIFPGRLNRVGLTCTTSTGTYAVNWGDGSTDSAVTSNVAVTHLYDYDDVDLPAVTSRGYKVAIITVTPNTGNLTVFNPTTVGTGNTINQYLEFQINGTSLTTLPFNSGSNPRCSMVEHINIVATGTVTSISFNWCIRLQKLQRPSGLFGSITNFASMFANCNSLRSIDLTGISASITTMNSAFGSCTSLRSLTFPSGTLGSSLLDVQSMFSGCTLLESLSFPTGAFSHCTNATAMFANTVSLKSVTFPSGAFAALVTMTNMFSNTGLPYVELPAALTAVTSIAGFINSSFLMHVKFQSGSFGAVTTAGSITGNPHGQAKIEGLSIPITFTLVNGRLEAASLDEIYTALPTVAAQTITVSGNPGTTGDTPSIATSKGWTVTG